jgi:hypothetical protein
MASPQLRGRSAKAAVLGNAQERLDAVGRTLPNCEVLLHNPSTLSRIVVRLLGLTPRNSYEVRNEADIPELKLPKEMLDLATHNSFFNSIDSLRKWSEGERPEPPHSSVIPLDDRLLPYVQLNR